ncbi:hypothetical protein NPIL_64011 [Nephila pilipes]|uniref:Uncharacterized protein n=1 Tax=Nephila pilipes TaxID=299642 RepID=A0A8X6Q659_NEPPI|nr:hypothetical protein NPIL_64011 [Nephila pilipes]
MNIVFCCFEDCKIGCLKEMTDALLSLDIKKLQISRLWNYVIKMCIAHFVQTSTTPPYLIIATFSLDEIPNISNVNPYSSRNELSLHSCELIPYIYCKLDCDGINYWFLNRIYDFNISLASSLVSYCIHHFFTMQNVLRVEYHILISY